MLLCQFVEDKGDWQELRLHGRRGNKLRSEEGSTLEGQLNGLQKIEDGMRFQDRSLESLSPTKPFSEF